MSFIGDAIGDVFGGITGAKQAGKAAEQAGQLQSQMYGRGIDEQRRQFDKLIELMSPYVGAGQSAMGRLTPYEQAGAQAFEQQKQLAGLSGADAQQKAISGLEGSPIYQQLLQQGENAMLQNASATGGLRGGNVQGALAQYRPAMLNQLIEQQYSKLGGLAGTGLGVTSGLVNMGQASAAGQAGQGMNMASNIGNLLANQGAAQAGGIMGRGSIARNTFGDLLNIGKTAAAF